jgi:hypothetical protein
MVVSNVCGPMVIVPGPSLCIVLRSGLFTIPSAPFFFEGFVQYFSKTPSASHFARERCSDAASIAESAMVWYSFVDSFDGWGWCEVGSGRPSVILVGSPSSMIGVDGRLVGVASGKAFRLLYLLGAVLGVDFAGVDLLGVGAGFAMEIGEDASLFVADSRRSRAGSTRFCGTTGGGDLTSGSASWPAIGRTGQ